MQIKKYMENEFGVCFNRLWSIKAHWAQIQIQVQTPTKNESKYKKEKKMYNR